MSDDRKKAKSRQAPEERTAEVAARLGMGVDEIAVFKNTDGEYAVIKDGTRLLLQPDGTIAWYGDVAPNPAYPLVRPTVELDESELEAVEAPAGPSPSDGLPVEPLPPDAGSQGGTAKVADARDALDAAVEAKAGAAAVEKAADARAEEKADKTSPRGTAAKK